MPVRTTLRWFGAGALAVAMGVPGDRHGGDPLRRRRRPGLPECRVLQRAGGGRRGVAWRHRGDLSRNLRGRPGDRARRRRQRGQHREDDHASAARARARSRSGPSRPSPRCSAPQPTTATRLGAVIGVYRSGVRQLVDISGVTVEGGATTVGSAVKFYNAEGSLTGSVIRNVAPLTGPQGYGVVIASNLVADRIPVRVAGTAISGYAKAGVVHRLHAGRARARHPRRDRARQHDHRRRNAGPDRPAGRPRDRARHRLDHGNVISGQPRRWRCRVGRRAARRPRPHADRCRRHHHEADRHRQQHHRQRLRRAQRDRRGR